jgi:hypothetical protein
MLTTSAPRSHRSTERLATVHARSVATDPHLAVAELARALFAAPPGVLLVFVAPQYDLGVLGAALNRTFPQHTVIGCTTAGQIGRGGFHAGGITAAVLSSPELCATPYLLSPLSDPKRVAADLADCLPKRSAGAAPAFGLLLVDGLSRQEERLTAAIRDVVGDLPFVGGSAGDDLRFEATHILHDGRFLQDAALFVLFETTLPFATFHFHDVVPTETRVRVTRTADGGRTVMELDGLPAAAAYAKLIGRSVSELSTAVFADHPWLSTIDDAAYVRSVGRALPDGSLYFLCAVEEGSELTLGARGRRRGRGGGRLRRGARPGGAPGLRHRLRLRAAPAGPADARRGARRGGAALGQPRRRVFDLRRADRRRARQPDLHRRGARALTRGFGSSDRTHLRRTAPSV